MRLNKISFTQHQGQDREWHLPPLQLSHLNLVVGKNASGKSKIINAIWFLARVLTGRRHLQHISASWSATFEEQNGHHTEYTLDVTGGVVRNETLTIGGATKLERGEGGKGRIWAAQLSTFLEFQLPENAPAALVRRDTLQHEFLESLHNWAQSVFQYRFGTALGRDTLPLYLRGQKASEIDFKDPDQVVAIFREAQKRHAEVFTQRVVADMRRIGFQISNVKLEPPTSVILSGVSGDVPAQLLGLVVEESDLIAPTEQVEMSQGMFRALSLLINIHFARLELNPGCFLIDDIGEGMDFSRSAALVKLLMTYASDHLQLIMTSNDRLVMNSVPLENWIIAERHGGKLSIRDYINSKTEFDRFKFTGLNNFDMLAHDFLTSEGD